MMFDFRERLQGTMSKDSFSACTELSSRAWGSEGAGSLGAVRDRV